MNVIACLMISPTEAVCAACARLTPVVEPRSDRVFMDWTGCGPPPQLAQRLHEELCALAGDEGGYAPLHRIGVAPLRFVAELLAEDATFAGDPNSTFAEESNGAFAQHANVRLPGRADVAFAKTPSRSSSAATPRRRPRPFWANTVTKDSAKTAIKDSANTVIKTPVGASTSSDPIPIAGGWYVPPTAVLSFIGTVPVERLPGIDEKTRQTLTALAVRVLDDLRRIRIGLLRSHIGDAADKLLAWARGLDPRPVTPLYPSERLSRRISGEDLTDALQGGGAERLSSLVDAVAAPLLDQLRQTGRAAAHVVVHDARGRRMRTFAEPMADLAQLARVLRAMAEQFITEQLWPPLPDHPGEGMIQSDLVIEIIPVQSAPKQMGLWDGHRPRNARHARLQTVLQSLRSRFGPVIGFPRLRGAVVHYETMRQLYSQES